MDRAHQEAQDLKRTG